MGFAISARNVAVSQAISPNSLAKQGKIVHDRQPMLAIGVMIWLGSELMFFSGLFAALFTIRAHLKSWPPVGTHLDVLQSGIFTIVLIASSFTMQWAVYLIENRRRAEARNWIIVTMIMGTLFVSNQAYEWTHLATRWYTNSYGSIFFITTGLHGLHVILGLVAMGFLLFRMRGTEGDPGELSTFQGVSYYWHFVDVVWIGLYSALFLLK
jgi:cytochrome c oxidase subunit 3